MFFINPLTNWRIAKRLAGRGILGMNGRNIRYISRYNPRHLFPLVDDKLKTKQLALEHGVTTPELLGVVRSQAEIDHVETLLHGRQGFCIKPAKGSGGKGILVILGERGGEFIRTNGQLMSLTDVKRHISNILAGLFSLGGATDVAVVEGLISVDDSFKRFTFEGVPDLRVIVFRGFPIMAMMRLSSASSHGKANLHQGAVGVGIDIGSGAAVRAVMKGRVVSHHPDTQAALAELQVPRWLDMLNLACACFEMTELGYLGVDLVLDAQRGPMLLELNARPGLSIQVANDAGLLPRLRAVEALRKPERWSLSKRVAFAREHFSAAPLAAVGAPPPAAQAAPSFPQAS